MAESTHHRALVLRAEKAVRAALGGHGQFSCFVDGLPSSDGLPPEVGECRPDVYAATKHLVVVGEAKPPWDIETKRSEFQLGAFLRFVEQAPYRHLVLAVHWSSSATARSILRCMACDWPAVRDRVHILDGRYILDFPAK